MKALSRSNLNVALNIPLTHVGQRLPFISLVIFNDSFGRFVEKRGCHSQ